VGPPGGGANEPKLTSRPQEGFTSRGVGRLSWISRKRASAWQHAARNHTRGQKIWRQRPRALSIGANPWTGFVLLRGFLKPIAMSPRRLFRSLFMRPAFSDFSVGGCCSSSDSSKPLATGWQMLLRNSSKRTLRPLKRRPFAGLPRGTYKEKFRAVSYSFFALVFYS
jgi:hypothetical protein